MKLPSSMRASKRCSSSASPALRMALRSSFGPTSIACVYMRGSLLGAFVAERPRLGPLVDDAARLADQRALDRIGQADAHRRADADQVLDARLQHTACRVAVELDVLGQHLAADLELVERAFSRDDELVLPGQPPILQHQLLDLC